jgi:hypothetical protein
MEQQRWGVGHIDTRWLHAAWNQKNGDAVVVYQRPV